MSAHYNRVTKRIVGCRCGSLTWYHEYRHLLQDRWGWLTVHSWFTYVWWVVLVVAWFFSVRSMFSWYLFGVLIVVGMIPDLLLELDAWVYAFRRMKKWW